MLSRAGIVIRSFEIVSLLSVFREENLRGGGRGEFDDRTRGLCVRKMSRRDGGVSATAPYRSRCRYQGARGDGREGGSYIVIGPCAVIGLPLTTAIGGPISWFIFI